MNYIFDFDGTIADTTKYFLTMANEVAKENNIPKISKAQYERARNTAPRQMLKELGIPLLALPKLQKASHGIFSKHAQDIELIPGMREVIIKLAKEHTLGVLTSNDAAVVVKILKDLELEEYFTFVSSAVNVLGKHHALGKIMRKQQFDPDLTIYIGDQVRDIEGAQKSGLVSAAVTWGFNTEELLRSYNPDYVITSPEQLLTLN